MLVNNAIQIISNARQAAGELSLEIARNVQKGLDSTDEQKDLRRRLLFTYSLLYVLDRVIPVENGTFKYRLGDYPTTKLNRILLFLRDISRSGERPVVPSLLSPVIVSQVGGGPPGPPGTAGQSAFVYIGYADDDQGNGFSTAPTGKSYIAFKASNIAINPVTATTFTGLWREYVGAGGDQGPKGDDGTSNFIHQAWADDDSGAGFTLTFDSDKAYTAFVIKSTSETPTALDFDGRWGRYLAQDGQDGQNGQDGASAYLYIAWADDDSGSGFTLTFDSSKDYVAFLSSTIEIPAPAAGDFSGLWKKIKGDPGEPGDAGAAGADGQSAFVYIAYADDNVGTGFTLGFDPNKEYIAIRSSAVDLGTPTVATFSGLWRRYKGNGDRYRTSSTTSLTLEAGVKVLNVETGLAYVAGQRTIIVVPGDPSHLMSGLVTFYDQSTGQMQIDVDEVVGSGAYSTWDVNLIGAPSVQASKEAYFATLVTDQGSGGGGAQTVSNSDPVVIDQWDTVGAISAGIQADTDTGEIILENNGAYVVHLRARISGPTSDTVTIQVYRNDQPIANMIDVVAFASTTSQELVNIFGIIPNGQQADVFDVRAITGSGAESLLVEHGAFAAYTIGHLESEQFSSFIKEVDTGTETVDSFPVSVGNGAKWEVLVTKGSNIKRSTIVAAWDGSSQPSFSEVGASELGTVGVTLAIDFDSGNIRLRATAVSDDWIVKGERSITGFAGGVEGGGGGGGGGDGSITELSVGDLSPLFTSNVANPTTTPAVTFTAANQNAKLAYMGPVSGEAAAPSFRRPAPADINMNTARLLGRTTASAGDGEEIEVDPSLVLANKKLKVANPFEISDSTSKALDPVSKTYFFNGSDVATWTLFAVSSVTEVSGEGDGIKVTIKNRGSASLTIEPDGSDKIYDTEEKTAVVIPPSQCWEFFCDGTYHVVLKS